MKNYFWISFFLLLSVMFYSCKKGKTVDETSKTTSTDDSTQIDLDLSEMNYNMLSSITFDIMVAPEKYVNKRVKAAGNFYTSVYEGTRYFSAIILDSTGCCPAGMDFIPPDSMKYPEDFPEMDEKITVIGRMIYKEIDGQKSLIYQAEEILF